MLARAHTPNHRATDASSPASTPLPAASAAAVHALQRTAGNAAVTAALGRQPRQALQRCPGADCTCGHDDEALTLALVEAARSRDTPGRPLLQRQIICPDGVDPEDGTGCYEVPDDAEPSLPDGEMTPASGSSYDPDEGGVSEPPADGGFTPVPGAESHDPQEGCSTRPQPTEAAPTPDATMTPAAGASYDPDENETCEPPPDGGFTPVSGAESYDPDSGGTSRTGPPVKYPPPWDDGSLPPLGPPFARHDEDKLEVVTEEEFQRREQEREREEMLSCEHLHGEPLELCELQQQGRWFPEKPATNKTPAVPPAPFTGYQFER